MLLDATTHEACQSTLWPATQYGCLQVTVVMKFGGSSVATAERMREVLDIIQTFPEHLPCVVLSAMGKVR